MYSFFPRKGGAFFSLHTEVSSCASLKDHYRAVSPTLFIHLKLPCPRLVRKLTATNGNQSLQGNFPGIRMKPQHHAAQIRQCKATNQWFSIVLQVRKHDHLKPDLGQEFGIGNIFDHPSRRTSYSNSIN
jgi:hypothetical protein